MRTTNSTRRVASLATAASLAAILLPSAKGTTLSPLGARRTVFYQDANCQRESFREYVYSARSVDAENVVTEGEYGKVDHAVGTKRCAVLCPSSCRASIFSLRRCRSLDGIDFPVFFLPLVFCFCFHRWSWRAGGRAACLVSHVHTPINKRLLVLVPQARDLIVACALFTVLQSWGPCTLCWQKTRAPPAFSCCGVAFQTRRARDMPACPRFLPCVQ